jgi:hypothetical protein
MVSITVFLSMLLKSFVFFAMTMVFGAFVEVSDEPVEADTKTE